MDHDGVPSDLWKLSRLHPLLCLECLRADAPTLRGPRRGEGHFGIRLGDDTFNDVRVLDGDRQLIGVVEVEAGERGWVLELAASPRLCRDHGEQPQGRIRIGTFRVEN